MVVAKTAFGVHQVRKRSQPAPAVVGEKPPVEQPSGPALIPFRVRNLRVIPKRVKLGKIVNVFAEAINASPVTNSYSLVLRIKGMVEAIKDVNLGPGQSQKVGFSILKDKPGVYDIDLEGLGGSFTVEG